MSASGKAPGIMLKTPALVLMLAMLLSACSLAPHYDRPEQEMPKQWRAVDMGSVPLHTDWWNRFNDPVLSELVEEALRIDVVQQQLNLLRFRNTFPAFGFDAKLTLTKESESTLTFTWEKDGCKATLDADFSNATFSIVGIDAQGSTAFSMRID